MIETAARTASVARDSRLRMRPEISNDRHSQVNARRMLGRIVARPADEVFRSDWYRHYRNYFAQAR